MIYVDRSVLKDISEDLRDLTDEASQLLQYHHLIVAAFTDEDKYPPDIQVDKCLFLLGLFLREWDRERLEQFVENLNQTHTKLQPMTTNEITVKPKGGRGKRADYNTVQVRCPEPVKTAVVNLIDQWRLGGIQPSEQPTELMELQAEIEALKQLNKNLNTTIEELRKRNKELDNTLEINTLKTELTECKINLNTSIQTVEQLNLNTGMNQQIKDILRNALTLKANAGGKIKNAIKQVLTLLE